MSDLSFRRALEAESDLVADLVFGSEDDVGRQIAIAIYGVRDGERLRPLFRRAWRDAANWRHTTLAIDHTGEVVGLVQTGRSSLRITPRLVVAACRALRWRALRLPWRLRVFDAVSPGKPDDAFVVSELHVHPEHRGAGIGSRLLRHAEELARTHGHLQIALDTYTTNPARRLYERSGYETVAGTFDARFERLCGTRGRVLYVKQITEP
jgi:ribosomal protein S18 acetylase RimI-like enzyme